MALANDWRARGDLRGGRQLCRSFGRMGQPTLVVMAKVPAIGRVKTRLGREIGAVAATQFYRTTLAALLRRLARDSRWRTIVAVAPDRDRGSPALLPWLTRTGQGEGDLGQRMQRVMDRAGCGPVIIIGTDIPAIAPRDIAEGFRALGSADAVFGPAPDGGYWLVGFKRSPAIPRPFGDVRWSSTHALADTLAGFDVSANVRQLRPLADVDDGETFRAMCAWSGRVVQPKLG